MAGLQQMQMGAPSFRRRDPPPGMDLQTYYQMPPACRITHVAGLGSGFPSPRPGTPFFFDEDRQDWLNSLGDSYGGFYALELWENGFLT